MIGLITKITKKNKSCHKSVKLIKRTIAFISLVKYGLGSPPLYLAFLKSAVYQRSDTKVFG